MIYLKQHFDLEPASPATRDRFIELAEKRLIPSWERHGARLVGAWLSNEHWFSRLTNVVAFEDLASFDAFRRAEADDAERNACERELDALCAARDDTLLEPLGAIPASRLDEAIAAAAGGGEAAEAYTFAILQVEPGQMDAFSKLVANAGARLPILACWRHVAGNRNEIIDLWRGAQGNSGYQPNSPGLDAFFGPLRKIAPREEMVTLWPLPYSPLK